MRSLSKMLFVAALALTFLHPVLFGNLSYAGSITGGSPGYPGVPSIPGYPPGPPGYSGVWNGLTTNTDMLITLDSPVAMVGNQPDMTYCVKKVSFSISGFDYNITNTDVTCDVAASDDRKSVMLYPQALLDNNSRYAYRIENINFQGGGSAGHFSQCYATGNNPVIPLANSVKEADLCTDSNYVGGFNGTSGGNYCFHCHVDAYIKSGTIGWDFNNFPVPTCTP